MGEKSKSNLFDKPLKVSLMVALFAFIMSLGLSWIGNDDYFPKFTITSYKGDIIDIVMSLVIAAVTFFLPWLIMRLSNIVNQNTAKLNEDIGKIPEKVDNAFKKWEEENVYKMHDILDNRFAQVIKDFTESHKVFIQGWYNNYPYQFSEYFYSDSLHKNIETTTYLETSSKGFSMWKEAINVSTYSALARNLLDVTKTSLHSTIFYDLSDLLVQLVKTEDKDSILNWLLYINQYKGKVNNNLKVYRTHIFSDYESFQANDLIEDLNRYHPIAQKKNISSLIKQINSNIDFQEYLYMFFNKNHNIKSFKYLVDNINSIESDLRAGLINFFYYGVNKDFCFDYKIYLIQENIFPQYYGEYMIFDEQVLLKFDPKFKVLYLWVGPIVKQIVSSFDPNLRAGIQYLSLLNGKQIEKIIKMKDQDAIIPELESFLNHFPEFKMEKNKVVKS